MTLMRKRQTVAPSSVDSLILFARAMSNSDLVCEFDLVPWRDGPVGLSAMKSVASSQPYFLRSLAASSLWQIMKSSRSPVMTSTRKSMMVSPLSVFAWILCARSICNWV